MLPSGQPQPAWPPAAGHAAASRARGGADASAPRECPRSTEPARVTPLSSRDRPPAPPSLAEAPEAWQQTQREIAKGVEQLKSAIRTSFADEAPDLIAQIDASLGKLDGILDRLDDRLSGALRRAHEATDPTARARELKDAKAILADYIAYVKSEPLIEGIDANPFGVRIDLKARLTSTLTHMAVAIGR